MKKNLVPLLGIAFVVAILATGVFYGLFVSKIRAAGTSATQPVVVASRAVERGAALQAADLKVIAFPAQAMPKGAMTSLEQAVGLTVVSAIQENEPVVSSRLASRASRGAGSLVPAGMRAISVHVADSSGIVSLLQPGQKVDVQVVRLRHGATDQPDLRTLLQNIEVLSVTQPDQGRLVVNLLTTPQETDLLGLADSTARIRLVLRNPLDEDTSSRPSVNLTQALQVPAPRAAGAKSPLVAQTR